MVKQRRAWARPLQIVSGIRPNMEVVKGYKERAKGLAITDQEADELFKRIYKKDPWKGDGPARKEVLKILSEMADKTPDFLFFNLLDNVEVRCRCYFNSRKDVYYLVHENFRKRILRRSITYSRKEIIIKNWHMNKIVWIEKRSIPDSEAP